LPLNRQCHIRQGEGATHPQKRKNFFAWFGKTVALRKEGVEGPAFLKKEKKGL